MEILGILNITRDSFSDGGRFLEPAAALAHARQLLADGADIIDVGAQSTRPEAENVTAEYELARLRPVIETLRAEGVRVSVDTFRAAVMRAVLPLGVELINDVTALAAADAVAAVRAADCRVILMHAVHTDAGEARAERVDVPAETIVGRVVAFFERRLAELEAAGIARERLILDPGMGLFLGSAPGASTTMLRNLDRLAALGRPLCVSTTRKSFVGQLLAEEGRERRVGERGAGTLASELWAFAAGVQFIRTHDVRALRDAVTVWRAIAESPSAG